MSIALTVKVRELEQKVEALEAKVSDLVMREEARTAIVQDLIAKVEAIENRPRVGRPPKDSP